MLLFASEGRLKRFLADSPERRAAWNTLPLVLGAVVASSMSFGPGLDIASAGTTAPAGGTLLLLAIGGLLWTATFKMRVPLFLTGPLLAMAAFGTLLNVPVLHQTHEVAQTFFAYGLGSWTQTAPVETTLAVNVGGVLVPLLLSLLLLPRVPLTRSLLVSAVVAAIAYTQAIVVPDQGVFVSVFAIPVAAVAGAYVLARRQAAPVAYVASVVGTFVGADVLNLPHLLTAGATSLALGGAGLFDAIFVVGIIAASLCPRTEETAQVMLRSGEAVGAAQPRVAISRLLSPAWTLW